MKAFFGLILFVLFTVSSGVKILIELKQQDQDAWYALATIKSLDNNKLKIVMERKEVQKNSQQNTPDPFTWTKATPCKFQFIPDDPINIPLSLEDRVIGNHWIESKLANPVHSLQFRDRFTLTTTVGMQMIFEGYGTTNNGALLIMSTDLYNKSKNLFEADIKIGFNVSKNNAPHSLNTKVVEEWNFQPEFAKHKTMVLIWFQNYSEVRQTGSSNAVSAPVLTSQCYIMFQVNNIQQYAVGSVQVNQTEAKGTLRFDEIWNKNEKAWLIPTKKDIVKFRQGVFTFNIQAREVTTTDLNDFGTVFQLPAIIVRPLPEINEGIRFNFGEKGIVEFVHKGIKKLDVYYDKPSESLTLIGKNVLDAFESFCLATKAINENEAQQTGSDGEHTVVIKLYDSMSKLIADISVSDSLLPSDGAKNIFKNKLFQYSYTVLKTYR